ncbi:MAG: hypothetical protein CMM85_17050 [Rhodothermaceae bacterium]|nr:hypothetical protein [Rhodothermaceae bacterium]
MLPLFRRLRLPVALVALAILAGPTAGAVCLHAMAGTMDHGETAPAMPMEHAGDSETPPCHETPEAPLPTHSSHDAPQGDCASPCCTAQAPAPETTPPALAGSSVAVPAPTPVDAEPVRHLTAERVETVWSLPPRPTRLHAELQRFLI